MQGQKKRNLYSWTGDSVEWIPTEKDFQDASATMIDGKVSNRRKKNKKARRRERTNSLQSSDRNTADHTLDKVVDDRASRVTFEEDDIKSTADDSSHILSHGVFTQMDPAQEREKKNPSTSGSRGSDKAQMRNQRLLRAQTKTRPSHKEQATVHNASEKGKKPFHLSHTYRRKRSSQVFGSEKQKRTLDSYRQKMVQRKVKNPSQSSSLESQALSQTLQEEPSEEDYSEILRMIEDGVESLSDGQPQSQEGAVIDKRQRDVESSDGVIGEKTKPSMTDQSQEDGEAEEEEDIPSTAPFEVTAQIHRKERVQSSLEAEDVVPETQDQDMLDTVFPSFKGDRLEPQMKAEEEPLVTEGIRKRKRVELEGKNDRDDKSSKGENENMIGGETRAMDTTETEKDIQEHDVSLGGHRQASNKTGRDRVKESRHLSLKSSRNTHSGPMTNGNSYSKKSRSSLTKGRTRSKTENEGETSIVITSSDSEDAEIVSSSNKQRLAEGVVKSSPLTADSNKKLIQEVGGDNRRHNGHNNVPIVANVLVPESELQDSTEASVHKTKERNGSLDPIPETVETNHDKVKGCEFTSEDEGSRSDALLNSTVDKVLSQLSVSVDEEGTTLGSRQPDRENTPEKLEGRNVSQKRGKKRAKLATGDTKKVRDDMPEGDSSLETCLPDDGSFSSVEGQTNTNTEKAMPGETSPRHHASQWSQTDVVTRSVTTQTGISLLYPLIPRLCDALLACKRISLECDLDIITTSGSSTSDSETQRRVQLAKESAESWYSDLTEGSLSNTDMGPATSDMEKKPSKTQGRRDAKKRKRKDKKRDRVKVSDQSKDEASHTKKITDDKENHRNGTETAVDEPTGGNKKLESEAVVIRESRRRVEERPAIYSSDSEGSERLAMPPSMVSGKSSTQSESSVKDGLDHRAKKKAKRVKQIITDEEKVNLQSKAGEDESHDRPVHTATSSWIPTENDLPGPEELKTLMKKQRKKPKDKKKAKKAKKWKDREDLLRGDWDWLKEKPKKHKKKKHKEDKKRDRENELDSDPDFIPTERHKSKKPTRRDDSKMKEKKIKALISKLSGNVKPSPSRTRESGKAEQPIRNIRSKPVGRDTSLRKLSTPLSVGSEPNDYHFAKGYLSYEEDLAGHLQSNV
ncbi:uncharacterized protein [Apostichopus japonicus]